MAIVSGVGTSIAESTEDAVGSAIAQALSGLGGVAPVVAIVASTVEHDAAATFTAFRRELGPTVAIHGATSSLGVLGHGGVLTGPGGAIGVMLFGHNGKGSVAMHVASLAIGDAPRDDGRAVGLMLRDRGRAHGSPRAILMHASPGVEEDLLRGLAEVFPETPVFGGSAADHAIAGEWSVFTDDGPRANAISVVGFFGDVAAGGALVAPYEPSGKSGRVTEATGRVLGKVDGRKAADVLGEWVGEPIALQVRDGGNILAQTALKPLGIRREGAHGEHYVTVHPAQIKAGGTVDLFARCDTGETVCSMTGTREGLILAIPTLVDRALKASGLAGDAVKGAILIYCAGCAGSVGALLHDGLKKHLRTTLPGVPLLGFCTFGEQGHVPGFGNVHQDLALSLLLLG